jgi:hypothetical protein
VMITKEIFLHVPRINWKKRIMGKRIKEKERGKGGRGKRVRGRGDRKSWIVVFLITWLQTQFDVHQHASSNLFHNSFLFWFAKKKKRVEMTRRRNKKKEKK